jgi:hypothetical protein
MIKTAGSEYKLIFKTEDANGALIGFVISSFFSVSRGPRFKLNFVNYIGSATGGLPFAPNPAVAITDRGSNTIQDINGETITAYLSVRPQGFEELHPAESMVAEVIDGLAQFNNLYINEAGIGYAISFNASLVRSNFIIVYFPFINRNILMHLYFIF